MFHDNLIRTSSKARNRIYCALITMLLAAGNVLAEDDLAELDPQSGFSIFGVFSNLWDFLTHLVA